MKKNKLLLYFVLFLSATTCFAQTTLLNGKITNQIEVEGIHILNTTSRYNAISNEYGEFSIHVKRRDTLLISSVAYFPEKIVVTDVVFEAGFISVKLEELVNQLDEVVLGPKLSGNIATDLKNIKTEKALNFDDVGIPGFKGKQEEKIVPVVPYFGLVTAVDLEAMYKHLSGYYKKLKIKRKWEAENYTVARIINYYGHNFFLEAFSIPNNRLYDFILFCIETSELQNDFNSENFANVLDIFERNSVIYLSRFSETKE